MWVEENDATRAFPGSGQSNVQMTVGKERHRYVQPDLVERLPLRFVDRHSESQPHGELQALELEWNLGIIGIQCYPRNRVDVAIVSTLADNGNLKKCGVKGINPKSWSIA